MCFSLEKWPGCQLLDNNGGTKSELKALRSLVGAVMAPTGRRRGKGTRMAGQLEIERKFAVERTFTLPRLDAVTRAEDRDRDALGHARDE